MSKHEILIALFQTLSDIKENLKLKIDVTVTKRDDCILFSCKKENGRVQVFKIEIKAL